MEEGEEEASGGGRERHGGGKGGVGGGGGSGGARGGMLFPRPQPHFEIADVPVLVAIRSLVHRR
eukprot:7540749-Pyramimonas_sp.AAC.1